MFVILWFCLQDLKHENDRQSFLIDRLIQDKTVSIKSSEGKINVCDKKTLDKCELHFLGLCI